MVMGAVSPPALLKRTIVFSAKAHPVFNVSQSIGVRLV